MLNKSQLIINGIIWVVVAIVAMAAFNVKADMSLTIGFTLLALSNCVERKN